MPYNAFISYSHAADGRLAPALQSALQSFARPWYRLRALRVFRDKTSLSATPELWGSIERALAASEYFVLLASPEAASSPWVGKEVQWWCSHRSARSLLICVTHGQVVWDEQSNDFDWQRTNALPPALQGAFVAEPLYVDLSWARQRVQLSRRDARFQRAVTLLAATIHGRPMDEMAGEDVRQHRRTRMVATGAVMLILALAGVAEMQRRVATVERDTALALLGQISVNNALERSEQGDAFGALSWLVRTLGHDGGNPQRARQHRIRIGLHARTLPRLLVSKSLQAPLTDASFSPDGRRFVTASGVSYSRVESDGAARVWDAASGDAVTPPMRHEGTVYSACFSPDGSRVLSAGGDGRARVWDAHTGELLVDSIHPGRVLRLARFSPDGRLIATAGAAAQVWDARTGHAVTAPLGEPDLSAWHVAFSADGKRLLATYGNGYLDGAASARVWDIATGAALTPVIGRGGKWVYHGAFSPDGERFVLADADGETQVYTTDGGKPVGPPIKHADRAAFAAFTVGGERVVSAGWDGLVKLSQPGALELDAGGQVRELRMSPDARLLVAGSSNGQATVWDIETGEQIGPALRLSHARYPRPGPFEPGETPGPEFAVDFAPDGRRLLSAGWDGTVRIWDLAGAALTSFTPPAETALAVPPSAAPTPIEIRRDAHAVSVTEAATGRTVTLPVQEPPRTAQGHSREAIRHLYSDDGRWLVIANLSILTAGWLFIIDTESFAAHRVDLAHDGTLTSMKIGPLQERLFLVFGSDFFVKGRSLGEQDLSDVSAGYVQAWDLATGQAATRPFEDSERVRRIDIDASGMRLIGSWDRGLRIWDARSGEPLGAAMEHEKAINRFVLSADGALLATASKDSTARVWDAHSGMPRTPPLAHAGAQGGLLAQGVVALAFSADATLLATASAARDARLWNIETAQPMSPPLATGFVPARISVQAQTGQLVVDGHDGARASFDMRPVDAPQQALVLLAETLSMRRFDATGVLVSLDAQQVEQLLQRMQSLSDPAARPTTAQMLTWHHRRAAAPLPFGAGTQSRRFHERQVDRLRSLIEDENRR